MKLNYFFLRKTVPFILKECDYYSILPSVIVAQAILHSNNGTSELSQCANNIFATRVTTIWKVNKNPTYRFRSNPKERYIYYKKYKNYEECIKDYLQKINKRQHTILYENYDYNDVSKNIFYNDRSTTKEYSNKLIEIIEDGELYDYDIYVTDISTLGRALTKLQKYGIIDETTYWFNSKNYIDGIDKLLINASNKIRLCNNTKRVDLIDSINKFYENDIIENSNYWKNVCDMNSRIRELIRDIAVYLK